MECQKIRDRGACEQKRSALAVSLYELEIGHLFFDLYCFSSRTQYGELAVRYRPIVPRDWISVGTRQLIVFRLDSSPCITLARVVGLVVQDPLASVQVEFE